jgi:vacuolar-type H+-ATPase subunit E/Vma4
MPVSIPLTGFSFQHQEKPMYHYDYIAATRVSSWTSLGVKLPKPVADAIEVFDAIKFVEIGHAPAFDLESVTVANAEQAIHDFADQLAPSLTVTSDHRSALAVAKQTAQGVAARKVLAEARAAVPEVVKQLTPEFDRAATRFAEAVAVLPDIITSEALVSGGPAVLAAYQEALEARVVIDKAAEWVSSLEQIPGLATESHPLLRVLRPTTLGQVYRLDDAREARVDNAHERLGKVYVEAARLSVEFSINSPREAVELNNSIRAKAQAPKQPA